MRLNYTPSILQFKRFACCGKAKHALLEIYLLANLLIISTSKIRLVHNSMQDYRLDKYNVFLFRTRSIAWKHKIVVYFEESFEFRHEFHRNVFIFSQSFVKFCLFAQNVLYKTNWKRRSKLASNSFLWFAKIKDDYSVQAKHTKKHYLM